MSFLPQCDAAVFVTSVDTPMTAVETAFLADIRQHAEKVFFVVNKIDLLEDRERDEVLDYISQTIRQQTAAATIRIFPVSSRLGLEARLAGDSEGYARSGLAALEEALAEFLASEKSDALLVAVLNKSLRLTGGGRSCSKSKNGLPPCGTLSLSIKQVILHLREATAWSHLRQ